MKAIYKDNIGKNALPGAPRYMSLKEFENIITNCKVYTENFGSKNVSLYYTLAMMTRVDEVEEDKHINMTFTEFIEAVGRVSEQLEVPHPVDVSIFL